MTKISCFAKAVNKDAQTNPITPPSELAIKRKRQASVACLSYLDGYPRRLIHFLVCLITAHLSDGVLQHGVLLEEVMHGQMLIVVHRALQVEG